MLGWGVPLAVLVSVGILASAAVLGLQARNQAAGYATRDADVIPAKPVETPSSVATAITTATTTGATASWASTVASPSTTTEESTSAALSTTTDAAAS